MARKKSGKPEYKIIETSTVTDEALEAIINEYVREGWLFDHIQFAMREASKRPAMAFVFFIREGKSSSKLAAKETPVNEEEKEIA